jgi:hypothetical protein
MRYRSLVAPALASLTVALVAACVDTPTQPPLERAAPESVEALAPVGSDAAFLEVAREVPGFGGMYYDDAGRLNVHIQRQELAAAESQALVSRLSGALRARTWEVPSRDAIVLRDADYDFAQLAGWHERIRPALGLSGVVYTQVNHERNRLAVGIEPGAPRSRLEQTLGQLGVPAEAVRIHHTEPITTYSGHTLQSTVRPVAGGLQIHFDVFLCTFGFNVIRDDGPHWITNSHCSTDRGTIGTNYFQAIALEGAETFIGTEIEDPPFFIGGPCPLGRTCRFSDAAVATAAEIAGATFEQGAIYRPKERGTGTLEIDFDRRAGPFFRIVNDQPTTTVGQRLQKVGRTTGWTQARVTSTCANVNVANTVITMLCEVLVESNQRIAAPGDSGSPFFRTIPENVSPNSPRNDVELHGILWGGNAPGTLVVFSPMESLRMELTPFSAVAP